MVGIGIGKSRPGLIAAKRGHSAFGVRLYAVSSSKDAASIRNAIIKSIKNRMFKY